MKKTRKELHVRKKRMFRMLLLANSLAAFSIGLFTPFYYLFIRDFGGGIETFGIALGLMLLAQSLTYYFAGRFSDKIGRKPLLVASALAFAVIIIAYTFITELWQLYALQIIFGIQQAVFIVSETSFLGDLTTKATRGRHIGLYSAIAGVLTALGMMVGGLFAKNFGTNFIFYFCSATVLLCVTLLVPIKE